ncbi:MAG: type II secretion system protein [Gammaproteobacteria bacterium]
MMSPSKVIQKGVTLIEVLLVMVIMSSILVMLIGYTTQKTEQIRIDRATLQMQQILNAALAYYVNNGVWPVTCGSSVDLNGSTLQTAGYLPNQTTNNPWGGKYQLSCSSNTSNFSVIANFTGVSNTTLNILAGRLPMAVVGTDQVTSSVTVPGQNLNNARSVNFAGVYHSGACVPVPSCPTGMTAQVMVVPVSVSGLNDDPSISGACAAGALDYTSCSGLTAYPISSFTGVAYGPVFYSSTGSSGTANVPNCGDPTTTGDCLISTTSGSPYMVISQNVWRVCLSITTEKGQVTPRNSYAWGQATGSVMVLTRCSPGAGEPGTGGNGGPDFTIWQK